MAPTIVIAAGGTAGHVVPALAVADALRAEGADVVFVGGERAEAELVPAAGYELRPIARRGPEPDEPAEGGARGGARPSRAVGDGARGSCASVRPDAVMGGGGYVAGPVGAGRGRAADPARADRGRQPPRPRQPAARAGSRGASASPSRSPAATGDALPRDRPAGAAAGDRPRGRAGALRPRRRRAAACSSSAGRSARGRSTRRRSTAFAGAPFRVLHAAGTRDFEALRARVPRRRALRPARPTSTRFGEALLAARPLRRAGGRVDLRGRRARAAGDPRPVSARDRPTTRRRTRAGWRTRGAAVVVADAELTPERLRARGRRAARRPGAPGGDGAGVGGAGAARRGAERRIAARGAWPRPAAGRRAERVLERDDAHAAGDGRRGALHLVGLGGAGMSGYARVARRLGAKVSGLATARTRPTSPRSRGARRRGPRRPRRRQRPGGRRRRGLPLDRDPARQPRARGGRARGLADRPRADLLERAQPR